MVPRADIVAMDLDTPLGEALQIFREAGHSRVPVYRDTLDDPAGLVHIKDVMVHIVTRAEGRRSRRKIPPPTNLDVGKVDFSKTVAQTKLVREVLYVPPSMPALDLLAKMQTTRIHMGIVVDEYGGTDGLVSIEDLVEEIVGDIEDEHDEAERPDLVRLPDGSIDATARAGIGDLEEMLDKKLLPEERGDELDTLGGLVFDMLGRVPQRGEVVVHESGIELEIADADPRRIKRLVVHPGSTSENPSTE